MTAVMLLLCGVGYFGLITLIGKAVPGGGGGRKVTVNNKVVGYAQVGQKFTEDKYFNSRPSAVDYNGGGSGGSNKGPSNPGYLQLVQERIDTFLVHNPGIRKSDIPAELVTTSGSGLDPHLSPAAALVQVARISSIRKINRDVLVKLVAEHTEKSLLGPAVVPVLPLNLALDQLQ